VKTQSERDEAQDNLIRQNTESILRNQEAIRRQTAALEQIRDHYFPRRTIWKRMSAFFLKVVGAVTVAAGLMETADWYWNTRKTDAMAAESARVARRLFLKENDAVGAARFLEKAVELDSGKVKYRIALATVKGMAAIGELFDLGRPLTPEERERVDSILSEAVFLQEIASDEPMPYVLAAQAYGLRGEVELALATVDHAVALAPDNVQARVTACAMRFLSGDVPAARQMLAEAEKIDPAFPLVLNWKGIFALTVDHDAAKASEYVDKLLLRVPRFALAHVMKGRILMAGKPADLKAARASFARAIAANPKMTLAMVLTAETYALQDNLTLAKLWLDRALALDASCVKALETRSRVFGRLGDWTASVADLTTAIALAPFRGDLYRARASARASAGDVKGAEDDRKTAEALVKE